MKANEFVKEFGLDSFKAAMICPQFNRYGYVIFYSDEVDFSNKFIEKHADYMFKTSDVKRLVESWELVDSKGGLDVAKNVVKSQHNLYTDMRLVQAIADAESCQ